ncbi:MAG: hypothetical protein ACLTT1_05320 [[Clostridium] scindens]
MKDYDVIICVLKNDSYDSRELRRGFMRFKRRWRKKQMENAISEKASSVVMEKYLYWRM